MQVGQREKGTNYPVCRFDTCLSPVPHLSLIDTIVLELFAHVQTQWVYAIGMGGGFKLGIPYNIVFEVASVLQIPMNAVIFRKFQKCEMYILQQSNEATVASRKK